MIFIDSRFILLDYIGLGVKAIRAVMDESHKIFKCKYIKRSIQQTLIFYEYLIKALEIFCVCFFAPPFYDSFPLTSNKV